MSSAVTTLEQDLKHLREFEEWIREASSEGLRAHLQTERDELAANVVTRLLDWIAKGGTITFTVPEVTAPIVPIAVLETPTPLLASPEDIARLAEHLAGQNSATTSPVLPTVTPTVPRPAQNGLTPTQSKRLNDVQNAAERLARACLTRQKDHAGRSFRECVQLALREGVPAKHTRLVNLCALYLDELKGPHFAALRSAIREQLAQQPQQHNGLLLPEDWKGWRLTRNKRLLLLGGYPDSRSHVCERIKECFACATVEWESPSTTTVDALSERIRRGGWDLILMTRFNNHTIGPRLSDACATSSTPVLWLTKGYNPSQIRAAIEHSV